MRRREFLGLLACAAAGAWAGPAPATVALAWASRDRAAEPEAEGVAFGLEEAGRTAALLAVTLRQVSVDQASVVVATTDPPRAPLVIDARCGAAHPLRQGVFAIEPGNASRGKAGARAVLWHPGRTRFGGSELNARWRALHPTPMDEAAWAGWMAVKVAFELVLRGGSAESLARLTFDGHKGAPLRFGPDRRLQQPIYVLNAAGKEVGA